MTYRPRLGVANLSVAQQARRGLLQRIERYPRAIHAARLLFFALALIGGLLGLWDLWLHLTSDPISDARAYSEAASRLNHGLPLYPPNIDPSTNQAYLYPPLLAILLRPLALLPYYVFALTWEILVVGTFLLTIRQLGGGFRTYVAIGILGIPFGWALSVGQAHVPMTLLLAIGQPWSIAFAANIKIFPALIALWWIGRRDYQSFIAFVGYSFLFGIVQLVLDPEGTFAFLKGSVGLGQIGQVRNFSPYVWASPLAWSALVLTGILVTVGLARTRYGWAAAVVLSTLSPPRLLVYMLTGLLAAVREPRVSMGPVEAPDAASAYVASAR
ncbi:MAG TPA: glycosyltransferase 87 family protein [Candidatus Limnocylindrales bacterium]